MDNKNNPHSEIRNPQSELRLMLDGELDQGVAAAQVEFGGDVVAMMFDGADADAHGGRDCAAGMAFGDQLHDAALGGRELFQGGVFRDERGGASAPPDEKRRERGADVNLPGDD